MGTPHKFDEARRATFLKALEEYGEITAAAAVAGISRSCAYVTAQSRANPALRASPSSASRR